VSRLSLDPTDRPMRRPISIRIALSAPPIARCRAALPRRCHA